ncbi:TlpA family protein disulfide reductase [Pirellulaceae bacterium SH449]
MKKYFQQIRFSPLKHALIAAVPLLGMIGCNSTETNEISAETSGYKPATAARESGNRPSATDPAPADSADLKNELASQPAAPTLPVAPNLPDIRVGMTDAEAAKLDFMTLEIPTTEDPEKITEYIRENTRAVQSVMEATSQQKLTREAALKRVMTLGRDMVTASTLLAANATTDEHRINASLSKLQALAQMMAMGDVSSADDLRTAAAEEASSEIAEISEQATGILLALSLSDYEKGTLSQPVLVAQLEKALKLPSVGQPTLEAVATGIQLIESKTGEKQFDLAKKLANAFRDSEDPRLALSAWNLAAQQAPSMKMLQQLFQAKEIEDTQAMEDAINALITELDSPWTAAFLADITTQFEYTGKTELAAKLVKKAEELAAGLNSEAAKQQIAESCSKFWKRASVLGSEIPWDGLTELDGKPFQFDQYNGKIVIMDIWATWCGPCIRELPNLKEVYAKYQSQGVEVLGVNIDEEADELSAFLEREELPWKTIVSGETAKRGFETQLVQTLGITGIPFIAIIDRDGKVAALHTRGPALAEKIEELLGSAKND